MFVTRIVNRICAYRRYRATYLRTIDQLSNLTNRQLHERGIESWQIADHARLRARGLCATASAR